MSNTEGLEKDTATGRKIVVVGAGLVGAVQALLLARAGFQVTVIEQRSLLSSSITADNNRTVALSDRSCQLLTNAGLWPAIEYCPIRSVCVTEQGKFGSVKLDARKLNVEALGYVLSNTGFEIWLHDLLRSEQNKQCAVLANVCTANPHQNIAFERFTKDGPLALLPLCVESGGRERSDKNSHMYSMIFTASIDDKKKLEKISDHDFLCLLQKKFGGRLGRFEKISRRFIAPLKLVVSAKQVDQRFVLIGNAARTALAEFVRLRHRDQSVITSQADILARAFTQKPPLRVPISLVSGLSFFVLDFLDPVKKTFATMNMGRHVPLPGRNITTRNG